METEQLNLNLHNLSALLKKKNISFPFLPDTDQNTPFEGWSYQEKGNTNYEFLPTK